MQDKISKSLQGKEHALGVFIDFEKAYGVIHLDEKDPRPGSHRQDVRLGQGLSH